MSQGFLSLVLLSHSIISDLDEDFKLRLVKLAGDATGLKRGNLNKLGR